MANHIRIVFGPTLYFIPINRNRNFIRLSELALTAWRRDGPSHFHCIWFNQISCWENICLLKRDWLITLHVESIRSSLQHLKIGILSVSAHESCVCWAVSLPLPSSHGSWGCSCWIWIPMAALHDLLGMFNLFLNRTADVLAPRLAVVFLHLIWMVSFPVCFRVANVTPILKVLLPHQEPVTDQFP